MKLLKFNGIMFFAGAAAMVGLVAGCDSAPEATPTNTNAVGASCTVSQQDGGALIECPDGTTAFLENGETGLNGVDGAVGETGDEGKSCTVLDQETEVIIECEDGTTTTIPKATDVIEDPGNTEDPADPGNVEDPTDQPDPSAEKDFNSTTP